MSITEFFDLFIEACDFIDEPDLTKDTRLDEIEDFDSLAMLGVLVMFETQFNKTLTGPQVMALETLEGLYKQAI